jgi:hypothetical protein
MACASQIFEISLPYSMRIIGIGMLLAPWRTDSRVGVYLKWMEVPARHVTALQCLEITLIYRTYATIQSFEVSGDEFMHCLPVFFFFLLLS